MGQVPISPPARCRTLERDERRRQFWVDVSDNVIERMGTLVRPVVSCPAGTGALDKQQWSCTQPVACRKHSCLAVQTSVCTMYWSPAPWVWNWPCADCRGDPQQLNVKGHSPYHLA